MYFRRCAFLFLVVLLFVSSSTATPILIGGSAWGDNDNDQRIYLSFGFLPESIKFENMGSVLFPQSRECTVGLPCAYDQIMTGANSWGMVSRNGYDPLIGPNEFAWLQLDFNVVTEPVQSLDYDYQAFAQGTFTGQLLIFTCTPDDPDDCDYARIRPQGNPILNEDCGADQNQACDYFLSGTVEGLTQVLDTPRPNVSYKFMGTANLVPEPSTLVFFGTGVLSLVATARRRLRSKR